MAEGRTVFLAAAYPHPELFVSTDGLHFSSLPVPCSQETGRARGRSGPASSPPAALLTWSLPASGPNNGRPSYRGVHLP